MIERQTKTLSNKDMTNDIQNTIITSANEIVRGATFTKVAPLKGKMGMMLVLNHKDGFALYMGMGKATRCFAEWRGDFYKIS